MTEGPEAPSSSGGGVSPDVEQRGICAESVLELIGRTPLVRLARMETAPSMPDALGLFDPPPAGEK